MRRYVPSALGAIILMFSAGFSAGCGILDDFSVDLEDEATIDGTYLAGTTSGLNFGGDFNSLNLSSEKTFADQGADPNDVDAIFIKSVETFATNPMDENLRPIIRSITLYVEAQGQAKTKFAEATLPDTGTVTKIEYTVVPDLNLKPFATSTGMKMSADIALKQTPLFSTTLKTRVALLVDINLLGI